MYLTYVDVRLIYVEANETNLNSTINGAIQLNLINTMYCYNLTLITCFNCT